MSLGPCRTGLDTDLGSGFGGGPWGHLVARGRDPARDPVYRHGDFLGFLQEMVSAMFCGEPSSSDFSFSFSLAQCGEYAVLFVLGQTLVKTWASPERPQVSHRNDHVSFVSLNPGPWTVVCCPGWVCLLGVRQSSNEARGDVQKKRCRAPAWQVSKLMTGRQRRAGAAGRQGKPGGMGGAGRSDHKRGRPRDCSVPAVPASANSACIMGSRGEALRAGLCG